MNRKVKVIVAVVLGSFASLGGAGDLKTAVGAGLGGAGGAIVGEQLGGKTGTVVGGAAGGAIGAAATTQGKGRTGAIVGGAVGGGAGAAVGQQIGGTSGAVVGAGLGGAAGAAIGKELNEGSKPRQAGAVAVTSPAVRVDVGDEACGGKKKRKNHPGKGWAKGHNKRC